jgi:predicted RNA-binding protein with PIN domain/predicted  nucleic acid-binding Zn-ribbon protein
MNISRHLRSVLAPSIDAARAALRDLDEEEVPARLRPIARHGDGNLPLPLARTLLLRIDEDEWFRGKALEALERQGSDDAVSQAFLGREPGWWMAVAEAVAAAEVADAGERIAERDRAVETLRTKAKADRAKLKAVRRDLERAEKVSRDAADERLEPLRAAAATARVDRDRAEAAVAAMEEAVEAAEADRLDAERTAAGLSEQVRSAKRTAAQLRRSVAAGTSASIPREPAEVARWLDRASAALAPYRDATPGSTGVAPLSGKGHAVVPAGVAPDSAAAVDALAGVDGLTVLIDGHNLLGVLDASTMATGRARRALVAGLGKLARHLGGSVIEVVFDSDLEDGRSSTVTEAGIVVRFAQGDLIADDLIVERTGTLREAAVVVSDDREVRDRCGEYGATVLWSRALAEWL